MKEVLSPYGMTYEMLYNPLSLYNFALICATHGNRAGEAIR